MLEDLAVAGEVGGLQRGGGGFAVELAGELGEEGCALGGQCQWENEVEGVSLGRGQHLLEYVVQLLLRPPLLLARLGLEVGLGGILAVGVEEGFGLRFLRPCLLP